MRKLIAGFVVVLAGGQGAFGAATPTLDATRVDGPLAEQVRAGAPTAAVIVRFAHRAPADRFISGLRGRTGIPFRSIPAVAFEATRAEIVALSRRDDVERIELDARLPLLMPTATYATRARAVWDTQDGGPIEVGGKVIDGSGVGIAIVDSGVAGTHPDLAAKVAKNFKVGTTTLPNVPSSAQRNVFVETAHSDTTSGHGTHVAAIAAGDGTASGGRAKGSAPGAKIYGFGAGEGLHIIVSLAAASFDWVIANHDQVSPPIRVLNNSWGGPGAFDPENTISVLARGLLAEGIVITWAAGNGDVLGDGGTCEDARTVNFGRDPTPGLISVANYDDANAGKRDGALSPSSSRGIASDPSTWPDLAAPGSRIYSALNPTGAAGLALKALDLALAPLGNDGNPFGNALNQHLGYVEFRVGPAAPARTDIDWILFTKPMAFYNAHTGGFATLSSGLVGTPDLEQASRMRFFAGVPEATGTVDPPSASQRAVSAGDVIVFQHERGTGNPITVQITSPSGTSRTIRVRFPCEGPDCTATVDLNALFAGEPADGTWTVSPGPTVGTDNVSGDDFNPSYVNFDGTSMAAPHAAGIVALLAQADPTLTPAQIEDVLEDTAHPFTAGAPYGTDPSNTTSPSSCDKGHGLIDARAAVEQVLS